jgi:hypothetical protein
MYSTPIDLSFSYRRSAVEASLDIKKVQVEPNNYDLFGIIYWSAIYNNARGSLVPSLLENWPTEIKSSPINTISPRFFSSLQYEK